MKFAVYIYSVRVVKNSLKLAVFGGRFDLHKLLRHQGLPDAQLSVIANAVIVSRLLYALPAWGGFLSVELVNRINVFFDVCSVLVIFSVV